MRKAILQRFERNGITYGQLICGWALGHKPIYTLELPWLDNQTNVSCIPQGIYNVSPYSSAKYPNVFEICSVPNRTAILIHIGNYTKDTRGCILVGLGVNESAQMITQSRKAMEYLHSLLGEDDLHPFALEIKN